MPSAWQALSIAGFVDRSFDAPRDLETGSSILETRLRLPKYTGSWMRNFWINVGAIAAFILVFRAAAVAILARRLAR